MGDIKGECKAHGHLGAVHMSLANYTNAMKCYEEQLERAKELKVRSGFMALLSWRCKYNSSSVPVSHHHSHQHRLFPPSHPSPSLLTPFSSSLRPSLCLSPILYHHSHRHTSSFFTHHLALIISRRAYRPPLHPSPTIFPLAVIVVPSIHHLISRHYFLPFSHPLPTLPVRC